MKSNVLVFVFMFVLAPFLQGQTCDDFDTTNTTTIGGWTEQSQDWSIESNRLKAPAATTWNFITRNGSTLTDGSVSGRAIHSGINQTQFVGIVARYTNDVTNVMLKVQDNSSAGYFDSYFLSVNNSNVLSEYTGLNLGSDLNFRMELAGASVRLMIDPERDGIWNIDTVIAVANTSAGLCGVGAYSTCYLDDFCYESCTSVPDAATSVTGPGYACQLESNVSYSTPVIPGATSYDWYYSGSGVSINGAGNTVTLDFSQFATSGSLTVSGVNACGAGTASATFSITVLEPVADMGLINGPDSVCQGQQTVLYNCGTLNNALDYVWSYTGTGVAIIGTSEIVSLDFAANATSGILSVYGENACGAGPVSPGFPVIVNTCLSLEEPAIGMNITPNPGDGQFSIQLTNAPINLYSVQLLNTTGQTTIICQQNSAEEINNMLFDVSHLPSGIYLLRLVSSDSIIDKVLQIQH